MMNPQLIDDWGIGFGTLPVPLTVNKNGQFVFQSGMRNDTCMQIGGVVDPRDSYESAWSVGAFNYIHANEDKLSMYNWETQTVKVFDAKRVENDFWGFIQYINRNSYRSEGNVLDFVLDLFRKMRNMAHKEDATTAINLLCRLLISLQEEDYVNIEEKWGVKSGYMPYAFDSFVEQIREGVKGIKPNLDLILRHCAGAIFEVANQEVTCYYPQRDLFGGVSGKLKLQKIPYASMHYTPLYLARGIVENVMKAVDTNQEQLTIIDPACGSGVFLLETLKQLRMANYNGDVHIKAYDKSTIAIQTTQFLLNYEKRTQWGDKLHVDIRCIDSLTCDWGKNDIVVMNPPFISWDLMDIKTDRPVVNDIVKEVISGKPNMASAFVYKAVSSLSAQGVVGAVIPSSIFSSDNYRHLRAWLTDNNVLTHVASLGSFVFESAVADTSFLILRSNKQAHVDLDTPLTIWCKNEKDIAPQAMSALHKMQKSNIPVEITRSYSIYHPMHFPIISDNWQIISAQEERFVQDLNRYVDMGRLTPMGQVLRIYQGVVTGLRDVFEISGSQYYNLPQEEKPYFRPLVDHDSFYNNSIRTSKYLWYPYNESGLMVTTEEQALSCSFVRYQLAKYKDMLLRRKGVTYWWELTRPRKELIKRQERMYSARFGNNNLFAIDGSGDAVSVEGNCYSLKSAKNGDDLYFYLAICSSNSFRYLLSIYAKRIRSGYDLSPKQVASLPIPDADNLRNDTTYQRLVEYGLYITNGEKYDENGLNELVSYFYPKRDDVY